jgi:predicted nucleic acid-binding protein
VINPVLIDTGCIVALLDKGERHHRQCVEVVQELQAVFVTCEAVIAESCHLLKRWPQACDALLTNVERGVYQIPFHLSEAAAGVRPLMSKYKQVPMDLADACLVWMAGTLKTGRILTLDEDFSIYRWHGHKPFENLLSL